MSALGQKRKSESVREMSALPPNADIDRVQQDVRFVPKADIPRCGRDWRYSMTSSGRVRAMSALPPKADMLHRGRNVRFVPKADIGPHSIISSARADNVGGTSMPSAFAVLRLITNSNLVDCTIGRSAGLAPLSI
jgi:hypothetical protein